MNRNIRLLTLFSFLLAITFFASCSKDDELSQDEIDYSLFSGNWELQGTDDDGSFTMHLKFNDDKTGTTDMYEFLSANFIFEIAAGKLTMTFPLHPEFTPNPAYYNYTFVDNNNLTIILLEDGVENQDLIFNWTRVN